MNRDDFDCEGEGPTEFWTSVATLAATAFFLFYVLPLVTP